MHEYTIYCTPSCRRILNSLTIINLIIFSKRDLEKYLHIFDKITSKGIDIKHKFNLFLWILTFQTFKKLNRTKVNPTWCTCTWPTGRLGDCDVKSYNNLFYFVIMDITDVILKHKWPAASLNLTRICIVIVMLLTEI